MASHPLQYSMQSLSVASLILTENQDVIQMQHHAIVNQTKENLIYDVITCAWHIHETKCHDHKLEGMVMIKKTVLY